MLNHIVLMGRLTRDPELRYAGANNNAVASFRIAVDRDFGRGENGEKQTDFIDVVAWRQTGEFVSKYFTKGSMAVVSGRLQMRDWTDRDGNKRELHIAKEEGSEKPQLLAGKTFVITGKVYHFENRDALKSMITALGGKAAGSVSSKTDYLINNDVTSNSSKNKKARELGIPILSEEEFLKMTGAAAEPGKEY